MIYKGIAASAFMAALTISSFLPVSPVSAATMIFSCTFPLMANEQGPHEGQNFSIKFHVDTNTAKAFMEGNNGIDAVYVFAGEQGKSKAITFSETLETGVIQTTTIALDTLAAVHSRNTILPNGTPAPSQWYGHCSDDSPGE